ncbi:type III polyketide synthase [Peribacillus alkalitolerans]|uniref:type III polyketide synthase n=1 Tax=Peribacillus alkalitolerans TaxID=1550385 RepID=UPI0013D081DF|nr:3-oxoacyl-[acyl-carrier-protein] synthase III C-terminal domain-containing protein [Peribacillus alkalitolerans]
MPSILSISSIKLPYKVSQSNAMEFAKEMFANSFKDITRLMKIFENGQVDSRYFGMPLEWFRDHHGFEEKNEMYIKIASEFGTKAIQECLSNPLFLTNPYHQEQIDAFIFVSSTGISTPTIDARIMNRLSFSSHIKRIPLWGLGCAGGASGLARAFDYCKAYPKQNVLVLCIELCSLTFQKDDISKSNLVGTSLFADGIACALVCGDESEARNYAKTKHVPQILASSSTLMPDSLEVMGWEVKDNGLYVIFSKDIPSIIEGWLKPNVEGFLKENGLSLSDISHFIAHPGGKKVLDAYQHSLGFKEEMLRISSDVLKEFGNMSSATILYVLERFMHMNKSEGEYGLAAALGPGFSSEQVLVRWEHV